MAEFYKFEIANWNEGTANLTLEQEAAYLRIINAIRLSDQPITFNLFVLCGLWRCNERKAKRILQELIDAGKVYVEDGKIINKKAVEAASNLRGLRVERASAGRRGGIESGKSRRKSLENNDSCEAIASTREEKRREEDIGGGGSARARETADPQPEVPTFRERILAAMGVGPDGIVGPSKFVGGQGDMAEAVRWLTLPGLTEDVAVAEVERLSAAKSDGPAHSFRYFTPAMQRLSAALTAPALTPTPQPTSRGANHDRPSERRAFDTAINRLADGLASGTVQIDLASRDPFAARS
jgi:hypothetical protein